MNDAQTLPLQKVMEVLAQNQTSNFVTSLCTQWSQRGRLSAKQEHWARKIAGEKMERSRARAQLPSLHKVFARMMADEIRIARMLIEDRKVQVKKAARREVFYVTVDGAYAGAIPEDGAFRPAKGAGAMDLGKLSRGLIAFADDPMDTMVRYGHATGECGVCGRTLTDPGSIEAGIGPVCAGKFA